MEGTHKKPNCVELWIENKFVNKTDQYIGVDTECNKSALYWGPKPLEF